MTHRRSMELSRELFFLPVVLLRLFLSAFEVCSLPLDDMLQRGGLTPGALDLL